MDPIQPDACLAPAGETWRMLLRQEAALDRSIDRKAEDDPDPAPEHPPASLGAAREPPLTGTPWRALTQEGLAPPGNEPSNCVAQATSKVVGLEPCRRQVMLDPSGRQG